MLPLSLLMLLAYCQLQTYAQQSVPDFSLVSTAGNTVTLSQYASKKAIVVIFYSNHCVYCNRYEDRILALSQKYQGSNIQFLLINANNPAAGQHETLENMKAVAAAKNYPMPYLHDPQKKAANSFGATKNPEAYIVVPVGGEFKMMYHGRIDDNALSPDKVTDHSLDMAIDSVVKGDQKSTAKMPITGCPIQ